MPDGVDESAESTDAIARFHEYREWLTPTAREDFRRTEIGGLTRAERAEERGVDSATVSANVRTAKDRLRAIAEDRGEPDIVTDGGREDYGPSDDPFACSRCGVYLDYLERAAGRDYCFDCRGESANVA
jgi:DNA-binding CsgD family transcriptional regulator